MDGRAFTATAYPLTLTITADAKYGNGVGTEAEEKENVREEDEDDEAVFDTSRDVASENGMFSDFQQLEQEGNGKFPEKQAKTVPSPMHISGYFVFVSKTFTLDCTLHDFVRDVS